jgi:hypothetical protein
VYVSFNRNKKLYIFYIILTESRKGTNDSFGFFEFFFGSAEAASARPAMTLPRVVKDLLMFAPSLRRTPVAPVLFARSLPAKSTRLEKC